VARRYLFRRNRRGGVEVSLEPAEADVIAQIGRELSALLSPGAELGGAGDPVLERLFPRAYLDPTEEEAEADWQRLVHDDLVDGRRAALETVERTLAEARLHRGRLEMTLTADQAEAWLAVLNDARLALGTRLEVTEDLDLAGLDPGDPDTAPYAVYWWLGLLQEHLVETLAGS
jgi:hypothetical protein